MFVSFLLPYIDRGQGPIFHWIMMAQLSKLGADELILIADERYFSAQIEWGRRECQSGISYSNPSPSEWQRVRKLAVPTYIFEELERKSPSMLEAFKILLTENYEPLSAELRNLLSGICRESQPEAILSWCNIPSLELVAEEFNIPVIHNELGPFRPSNYQGTVYFDFRGVNGRTSAEKEMTEFLEQAHSADLRPLSTDELRHILMTDPRRARSNSSQLYKAGAALQVENDSNMLAFNNGFTNFGLIFAARKGLAQKDLLIRQHPCGLLQYDSSLGVRDDSQDSIQFISRCERVFCTNSSVAFEALLMDKPVNVAGDSPVACLSEERHSGFSSKDFLLCLNYAFICYLVPSSLLFDAGYYRWRLQRPSLHEIYERHLQIFRQFKSKAASLQQLSPSNATAQLFLPSAAGYCDEHSIQTDVSPDRWNRISFSFRSRRFNGDWILRVDPVDRVSVIEIAALILKSKPHGRILWEARKPEDFDHIQVGGTAIRLPDLKLLKILSLGSDPCICLPVLNVPPREREYQLQLVIRARTSMESVAQHSQALMDIYLEHNNSCRELKQQLSAKQEIINADHDIIAAKQNMIEDLVASLCAQRAENRKTYIWGAGAAGNNLAEALLRHGFGFHGFIDRDLGKTGRCMMGHEIFRPSILSENGKRRPFILIASQYYPAIIKQLKKTGYRSGTDFMVSPFIHH
jgi:hypothetical protein